VDFCTNSCDYREDKSCDDGGPESDYQGCPLGTDCSDCGPRKIDLDQEKPKFHTFSGSDGLYKLQQKYGGSVAAMLRWNGLWDVTSIHAGQKLAVNAAAGKVLQEDRVPAAEKARRRRVKIASRVLSERSLFGKRYDAYLDILLNAKKTTVNKPPCIMPSHAELIRDPLPHMEDPLPTLEELQARFQPTEANGWWSPSECEAMDTVAIVIPFRNRDYYLRGFLAHMHKLLRKQKLRYQIFVVDQVDKKKFNRAKLLNVGTVEATKVVPLDKAVAPGYRFCFIMHDVDMISLSDALPYNCPKEDEGGPRHLSVYTVSHRNKCLYKELFGGVAALSYQHMVATNGYSNLYYGWGGEDDDMSARVRMGAGLKIMRPRLCSGPCRVHGDCMRGMGKIPGYEETQDENFGVWYMLGGRPEDVRDKQMDPKNLQYLGYAEDRYPAEGLNTLEYKLQASTLARGGLYTHLEVKL
jgi:LysM repeat protein